MHNAGMYFFLAIANSHHFTCVIDVVLLLLLLLQELGVVEEVEVHHCLVQVVLYSLGSIEVKFS